MEAIENVQDSLDKLFIRIARAKLKDGHNIRDLQLTDDPDFPVFLTKITIHNQACLLEKESWWRDAQLVSFCGD